MFLRGTTKLGNKGLYQNKILKLQGMNELTIQNHPSKYNDMGGQKL